MEDLIDRRASEFKTNAERFYIGVDPGKDGGIVGINDAGDIMFKTVMPTIGASREYDKQEIKRFFSYFPKAQTHIGIEKPGIIFGIGKSSMASLSHCVGLLEGIVTGLGIAHTMVAPKEWQKDMWTNVKKVVKEKTTNGKTRKTTDTKATSELAAINLYPEEDFRKSERAKNRHDGIVDAVLVANYCRKNSM